MATFETRKTRNQLTLRALQFFEKRKCAYAAFVIGGLVNDALSLNGELRAHGLVEFYLNGPKDRGDRRIEQQLQFALTFVDAEGKSVRSRYFPMSQVSEADQLDGDPGTWQLVTIKIADVLESMPDPDKMKSLQGVVVQYLDEPNTVYFTDCSVKLKRK